MTQRAAYTMVIGKMIYSMVTAWNFGTTTPSSTRANSIKDKKPAKEDLNLKAALTMVILKRDSFMVKASITSQIRAKCTKVNSLRISSMEKV